MNVRVTLQDGTERTFPEGTTFYADSRNIVNGHGVVIVIDPAGSPTECLNGYLRSLDTVAANLLHTA